MNFHCSICDEASTRICVDCTKDTCCNHLCEKCGNCSDCCACEVRLEEHLDAPAIVPAEPPVVRERVLFEPATPASL